MMSIMKRRIKNYQVMMSGDRSEDTVSSLFTIFFLNSGVGSEITNGSDGTIEVEVIVDGILFTRKLLDFMFTSENPERNFDFLSKVTADGIIGKSQVRSASDKLVSLENFNSAGIFDGVTEMNVGLSGILSGGSSRR